MIGPYEFPLKLVWTNGARSFSLDQHWSIECSSLKKLAKIGSKIGWKLANNQQLTYRVISEGVFCGKFAEILRKFVDIRKEYIPRGPKDQKNSRFRSRLKISIEKWKFRASHPPRPYFFVGEIETSRLKFSSEIKNFDRDQKFRSRSNFFDRWALWVLLRQERVRKFCGKFAEISRNFAENFRQWPLPERPQKWIAEASG